MPSNTPTKAYFDGGFRDNTVFYGFYVEDENGKVVYKESQKFSKKGATNVIAEYMGLILLLIWCHKEDIKRIHIYGDSESVIKQIKGEYKVREESQKVLFELVNLLIKQKSDYTLSWVPREFNSKADRTTR